MADDNHTYGPLLITGPQTESSATIIDLEAVTTTEPGASAADESPAAAAAPPSRSRWTEYVPLAAGIALVATVGALAGAGTTVTLMRDTAPPASFVAADAHRALQDSVAQLSTELAALKSTVSITQRSASTQFVKLTERVDRSEKAQAEPVAKIAKLQDSLERHQAVAAAPASEVTGSIAAPKDESKPRIAEGWRLRDFYDGRAVVESRNGTLFRVGPGSNVPGLGKVETIKRENGRIVVNTASGAIAGAIEPRRPNYYYRW